MATAFEGGEKALEKGEFLSFIDSVPAKIREELTWQNFNEEWVVKAREFIGVLYGEVTQYRNEAERGSDMNLRLLATIFAAEVGEPLIELGDENGLRAALGRLSNLFSIASAGARLS